MNYLTEKEYEECLKKIQSNNKSKERKQKLKAEKNKYKFKFKLPSTSKLVLLVVFLLCIEIIIFSQYAMIVLGDASAMYVLIGVPTTLVPTVLAYYNKSKKENTQGGITYDMAMLQMSQENINSIEDTGTSSIEAQG